MPENTTPKLPVLDLSWADDVQKKPLLLQELRETLYNIGFLYIENHGVSPNIISNLTSKLPDLFDLPDGEKNALSKLHSPHFLGYSGFAEETTLGKQDLREQFDFATELPVVYEHEGKTVASERDLSKLYWRLRGPNQWPSESSIPGFRQALIEYVTLPSLTTPRDRDLPYESVATTTLFKSCPIASSI